jgi:hypothetical protein
VSPAHANDWEPYIWQTSRVTGNIDRSATDPLRDRLIDEVRKVVENDVLAPLCLAYGDIPGQALWIYPERGRIITTLAYAYPHLPADLQQQTRAYVHRMLDNPLEQPWRDRLKQHADGQRRELHGYLYPAEQRWYPDDDEYPVLHTFYGLWLWGDRANDWQPIRKHWDAIVQGYLREAEHADLVLYGQLSGHIAMARLAERFNDQQTLGKVRQLIDRDFTAALDQSSIEQRQRQTFFAVYHDLRHRDPPRRGYFNGQPWMFLNASPEVMRFIRDKVRQPSVKRIEQFTDRYPKWWLAQAPYFTRWTGDESVGLVTPECFGMVFPFHRWVFDTEAEQLRLFLRTSPTGLGDCYWMESAVWAIEATASMQWQPVGE